MKKLAGKTLGEVLDTVNCVCYFVDRNGIEIEDVTEVDDSVTVLAIHACGQDQYELALDYDNDKFPTPQIFT